MTSLNIRLTGMDSLLRTVGADLSPTVRAVLHGVGELVRNEVAQAPGPVKKPIRWASEKQRRYVMAQVRRYGPWVRESHQLSQRLIASWTVRDESDYKVVVGNKATYGPWVQDADYQQGMHADSGWQTDQGAIDIVTASGDIETIMGQAFERVLSGR